MKLTPSIVQQSLYRRRRMAIFIGVVYVEITPGILVIFHKSRII